MRLKEPLTIQLTQQVILGAPGIQPGKLIVPVSFATTGGAAIGGTHLALSEGREVFTDVPGKDADGKETVEKVRTFEGGQCQRLVFKSDAHHVGGFFETESFVSETAYANALKALDAPDAIAALEAAGAADGWLMETGPSPGIIRGDFTVGYHDYTGPGAAR